jgi:hypothetical protein
MTCLPLAHSGQAPSNKGNCADNDDGATHPLHIPGVGGPESAVSRAARQRRPRAAAAVAAAGRCPVLPLARL